MFKNIRIQCNLRHVFCEWTMFSLSILHIPALGSIDRFTLNGSVLFWQETHLKNLVMFNLVVLTIIFPLLKSYILNYYKIQFILSDKLKILKIPDKRPGFDTLYLTSHSNLSFWFFFGEFIQLCDFFLFVPKEETSNWISADNFYLW